MKKLTFLVLFCFLGFFSKAYPIYLYRTDFSRIDQETFRAVSYFNMGSSPSDFELQYREEYIQNDTLFLKIAFETRMVFNAFFCSRADTIEQTLPSGNFSYINVSTGVVTYNEDDPEIADTLWRLYDSTFAAVAGLGEWEQESFQFSVQHTVLSVHSTGEPVSELWIYGLNGQLLRREDGPEMEVGNLAPGVYLLYVLTGSGTARSVKWYKE